MDEVIIPPDLQQPQTTDEIKQLFDDYIKALLDIELFRKAAAEAFLERRSRTSFEIGDRRFIVRRFDGISDQFSHVQAEEIQVGEGDATGGTSGEDDFLPDTTISIMIETDPNGAVGKRVEFQGFDRAGEHTGETNTDKAKEEVRHFLERLRGLANNPQS